MTNYHDSNDLDRALDAALAKYAAVDPRVGLEARVLANLRSGAAPTPAPRWQWTFATAALAIILAAAVLTWRLEKPASRRIAIHAPSTISAPPDALEQSAHRATSSTIPRSKANRQIIATRAIPAVTPKLDQFPSPDPLSPEEIALARYVRNFPKEAQLVAQAQQDFALETEKEMNDAGSETEPSGSTQQER